MPFAFVADFRICVGKERRKKNARSEGGGQEAKRRWFSHRRVRIFILRYCGVDSYLYMPAARYTPWPLFGISRTEARRRVCDATRARQRRVARARVHRSETQAVSR